LSSSNPNLQNIPIKSAYGKEIRKAFKAKENKTLISADYSQIELRVLAHLADEQALIEAFQNDQDIHARTAMEIFDLKENEVSEEQRRIGKTLNFALIYMQGPFATAKQLGISMSEAKNFTNTYFKVFPKIKPFMDKTLNDARQNEFTETLFGRRRFFRNLNSGNKILQKEEERQAFNAGIQGTAADIMKIAMINIAKRLENYPQASLILQVHDEIIVETDLEIKDEIKAIIEEEMSQATALKVPLKVEAGEGANWLLAH
jgi:DNA polymerase-1